MGASTAGKFNACTKPKIIRPVSDQAQRDLKGTEGAAGRIGRRSPRPVAKITSRS